MKKLFFADLGNFCIVYESREKYNDDPVMYTYKSHMVVHKNIIEKGSALKKIYPHLKLNDLCSGEAIEIIEL